MQKLQQYRFNIIVILIIACCGFMTSRHAQAASTNDVSPAPTSIAASNPQSIVVAKVNGQDITAADINAITNKTLQGVTDPTAIIRIKTQALNELINERLASNALESDSNSKTPEVVRQIERLKRQVMMNFYLSSAVANRAKVDPGKVDSYLKEHPELVANRQMFHFEQILINASELANLTKIQALINQDPSLVALQVWLNENKIPNGRNNFWKSTDQLNPALLSSLNALKKEKEKSAIAISAVQSKDQKAIAVLKLYDAYPDPVTLDVARATFAAGTEQGMRNQIAMEVLTGLRAKGNVQIFDQELAAADVALIASSNLMPTDSKYPYLTKALVIWVFSLLILVPVAVVVFYRQRIANAVDMDSLPPSMDASEFKLYRSHSRLIRRLVVIPILMPVVYCLFMPLYDFFVYPPPGLGLQVTSLLALAGLLFGGTVVTACIKVPQIQSRMKSGWVGLLTLIVIEFVFFWFGIHA